MAAGLSLEEKDVPVLEERLNRVAGLTQEQLTPKLYLDAELGFSDITEGLMEELALLEPFGNGNSKPVFASSGVWLKGMRRIGKDGSSLRLQLTDSRGTSLTGLYFRDADGMENYLSEEFGDAMVTELYRGRGSVRMTLAFSPSLNEYQGKQSPQIIVDNFKKTIGCA